MVSIPNLWSKQVPLTMEKDWSIARSWYNVCYLVICHVSTVTFEKGTEDNSSWCCIWQCCKECLSGSSCGGNWKWRFLVGNSWSFKSCFHGTEGFICDSNHPAMDEIFCLCIVLIVPWKSLPPCWMMRFSLVHQVVLLWQAVMRKDEIFWKEKESNSDKRSEYFTITCLFSFIGNDFLFIKQWQWIWWTSRLKLESNDAIILIKKKVSIGAWLCNHSLGSFPLSWN